MSQMIGYFSPSHADAHGYHLYQQEGKEVRVTFVARSPEDLKSYNWPDIQEIGVLKRYISTHLVRPREHIEEDKTEKKKSKQKRTAKVNA